MSVFLGHAGMVEIRRQSINRDFFSVIEPSDVNPGNARFSFDFPTGMLIPGDMLELSTLDGGPLAFIDPSAWDDNTQHPDGSWYIHVDQVGGIKLYDRFDQAVDGEYAGRIPIVRIGSSIGVRVRIRNAIDRCVAKVASYELNTEREGADVSELNEEFRRRWSTLMTGSGTLECFFDYKLDRCDPANDWGGVDGWEPEVGIYFHQLLLRQQLGSEFHAKLSVITRGDGHDENDEVWYEFDAIVVNAGIVIQPSLEMRSRIQFITTGEIALRVRTTSQYLLQESRYRLALERKLGRGYIEQESDLDPSSINPEPVGAIIIDTGGHVITDDGSRIVYA